MTTRRRCVLIAAVIMLLPRLVAAQNITFATAVQMVAGQPAVRVTLATGSSNRFYSADVVSGRSYCAEATASEAETNAADPSLELFHANQIDTIGSDTGSSEPKGQVAARVCFRATDTETVYIKLLPLNSTFENREYSMRFVETTLWANWFFVGGGYSSFTLIRNTTNAPIDVTIVLRSDNGTQVGTAAVTIPANGILARDARQIMGCAQPTPCGTTAGSVEIAHNGSPQAVVGSQTTLSGETGLSFDTIMFQRKPW